MTKLRAPTVLALVFAGLVVHVTDTAARGPSTPEERQRALTYIDLLEEKPGLEETKMPLVWLMGWLQDVPDITVIGCTALLGTEEEKEGIPTLLLVHHMYDQAAYLIRNPEAESGNLEVLVAGVEGTLRTYEAVQERIPHAHEPLFEKLLDLREHGELAEYVAERAKSCQPD